MTMWFLFMTIYVVKSYHQKMCVNSSEVQKWLNLYKSINIIHHINTDGQKPHDHFTKILPENFYSWQTLVADIRIQNNTQNQYIWTKLPNRKTQIKRLD